MGAIGSPWGPHPERGVYRTSDGGKSWEQILFVNEQTGVADMVIHPREHDQIVNSKIYAFEPPVAYLADTKNAPGYYFTGDAYFEGENRSTGARISYFVRVDEESDPDP